MELEFGAAAVALQDSALMQRFNELLLQHNQGQGSATAASCGASMDRYRGTIRSLDAYTILTEASEQDGYINDDL